MVGLWWPAQIVNLAGCLVMWVLKLEHGSGAAMHSRRGLRQHQFRSFNLQWDCETIKWCCVTVKQYYYNMVLKAGAFDFRQDRFLAWTAHKWLWLLFCSFCSLSDLCKSSCHPSTLKQLLSLCGYHLLLTYEMEGNE